jgi:hypothetical protein
MARMSEEEGPAGAAAQRDSRVLVFSQRNLHRPLWHSAQYEFEDLLLALDDVDLLAPGPVAVPRISRLSRQVINGSLRRVHARRMSPPWPIPSMRRSRVEAEHDLFIGLFHHSFQLSYLHRLDKWRERCRRAVCVLIEAWSPSLEVDQDYLRLLREFDVVYVFNPRIIPALRSMTGRPVRPLPLAVNTEMFSPVPLLPDRVLDCYSYGRVSPGIHADLLEAVEQDGLTYLYDSLEGGVLTDPRLHRALVANMMKRAQFFLAHRINDTPERRRITGGDEALSSRYFEGAAGGAVMLGSAPRAPEFAECFDWPDSVISVPYDSKDVVDVMADLRRDPCRLARIRADNVRNSLARHDWLHRWSRILDDVGLPPTAQMVRRQERLDELSCRTQVQSFLG